MTRALLLGALALLVVSSTACIGVGPHNDRLYVNEWKAKKQRPMTLRHHEDWVYEGEHWERQTLDSETAE